MDIVRHTLLAVLFSKSAQATKLIAQDTHRRVTSYTLNEHGMLVTRWSLGDVDSIARIIEAQISRFPWRVRYTHPSISLYDK